MQVQWPSDLMFFTFKSVMMSIAAFCLCCDFGPAVFNAMRLGKITLFGGNTVSRYEEPIRFWFGLSFAAVCMAILLFASYANLILHWEL